MAFTDQQLVAELEPQVKGLPPEYAYHMSLAISMKRIADEICGTKERYGVTDSVREAIEQGIINATRR
jgi:hypothetical protein